VSTPATCHPERAHEARGLCEPCYRKARYAAQRAPGERGRRGALAERLVRYVVPEPMSGCWLWIGALVGKGYGVLARGGKRGGYLYAHRVSYEIARGAIAPGLEIDHLCRTKTCVNPAHLEAVTSAENARRAVLARTA